MDWIYYLSYNNIKVSLPLTVDEEFIITVLDGETNFIVTAFEMAEGYFGNKNDSTKWNREIFYNWGKTMGDIHKISKNYQPSDLNNIRDEFTGKEALGDNIASCPSVNKIAKTLIVDILSLPKDRDSYGLIHYDFHQWNFTLMAIL